MAGRKPIGAPAIIIKDKPERASDFFREHDRGSARPAFCYPESVRAFKEEAGKLKKLFQTRNVPPTREIELKEKLRSMEERIGEIDKQANEVRKAIKADPDYWNGRRKELQEFIREWTPSKSDRKLKRVTPNEVLKREKGAKGKSKPLEHGGDQLTLQQARTEYQIISRAMDEESSTSVIERD